MELVFHPSSDHQLDDVIKRTTDNQGFALLVGDSRVWAFLSETTAVGKVPVRLLDLREVEQLSTVVSQISESGAGLVVFHDSPQLDGTAFRALIERLYDDGMPVVFHVDKVARLVELLSPFISDTQRIMGGVRSWEGRPPSPWISTGPQPMLDVVEEPVPPEEARAVNTLVAQPGREDPVERLDTCTKYELLLNIGPQLAGSLLPEPDAVWPEEQLPDGDLELRAVLTMDSLGEPLVAAFTLPAAGFSDWVRFPITTPKLAGVWTGELVIYYQVVPVHAQQLVLPVGLGEKPHARLLHRLTRSFADLGPLSERTASMLVGAGGSRVLVNGLQFADNPASISADAANGASRSVRQQLYDMHLSTDSKGRVSPKLNSAFGKDAKQFEADLLTLARLGWAIFDRLFHGNPCFDTLPAMIRSEASARQRVAVLNVADPTMSDPDRDPPLPWSLVYDLPLTQTGDYQVCESVREFGPGGSAAAIPAGCPHESTHAGYTLCPFGFWGLSCVIEQPASSDRLTWNVLDRPQPAELAVAVDPALDGALTRTHLDRLRTSLPPATVAEATVTSGDQLAAMLAGETMDVVYLYCHGGYYQLSTQDKPTTVLQFDKSRVHPADIAAWRANRMLWPPPHWPHRKPLVVLNGCHTVELTTATLGNFVDAFTNRAGASGVIGTEVTVEQGMAGWVMEELLHGLIAGGASAGKALRDVRWRMINRGNVMGLAYTLYCVAGLRLRPPA